LTLDEGDNVLRADEVDEGIADIASILEVGAKVQEVVVTKAGPVDDVLQLDPSEAVRDVADHQSGANILAVFDSEHVNRLRLSATEVAGTATINHWTGKSGLIFEHATQAGAWRRGTESVGGSAVVWVAVKL